jgi:aminopeptidase N
LNSSHPIEVEIKAPSEIAQVFDSISYCKGSAILRMLNDYVGEENFSKGLHNYLNKFRFKNAVSNDLWSEIDSASNKPVKSLMQVWTKEKGFPVVEVVFILF